jgi:hypothetical protein
MESVILRSREFARELEEVPRIEHQHDAVAGAVGIAVFEARVGDLFGERSGEARQANVET